MAHTCPHCGEDDDSVVPSAKALYLNWNGRQQFTGVADLNGVRTLLDDKWGPLDGPGRVLTREELAQVIRRVEQENYGRVTDDTPSLADLHADLSDPTRASRIRLHETERCEDRTERGINGVLDATPQCGDRVKIALEVHAACRRFELGAPDDFLARAEATGATEKYWAVVLCVGTSIKGTELTVLPQPELRFMPPQVASEPLCVGLKNVLAVERRG